MTYDEWITYGIMQRFCTRAACILHNSDELWEQVEETSLEQVEWDDPVCLPGVVLFPPKDES